MRKIFLFYALFFSSFVYADQLKLTNGDQLSGKFVSYASNLCVFETEYSGSISVPSDKIAHVAIDDMVEVSLKTGDKVVGHLKFDSTGQTIQSTSFGVLKLELSSIQNIIRKQISSINQSTNKVESFGEKDSEPPLNFLRDSTVTLKKGDVDIDIGFRYKRQRSAYQMFGAPTLENANTTARMLETSLSIRRGFGYGIEGWVRLPYTYTEVENVSGNDYVDNANKLKMSDVQLGLQYLLLPQRKGSPAVSLSLRASVPTGVRNYYTPPYDWMNLSSNGSGHWMLSPGIDVVKTIDPVALFGGVSYEYFVANRIDGHLYEPGHGFSAYAGVGYALNDRISLSTKLQIASYGNMSYDRVKMEGSSYEPWGLGFSATYRTESNLVIMPTVMFGLNSDAGTAGLGVSFSKRY